MNEPLVPRKLALLRMILFVDVVHIGTQLELVGAVGQRNRQICSSISTLRRFRIGEKGKLEAVRIEQVSSERNISEKTRFHRNIPLGSGVECHFGRSDKLGPREVNVG